MPDNSSQLKNLQATIEKLRSPEGCPWDRKQSPKTLIKYLQSETSELIEAINNGDISNTCEELGDVLYLLLMITHIHSEAGEFTFSQVVDSINSKLIRRHPHVFAGVVVNNEDELREQWQRIKAEEKSEK